MKVQNPHLFCFGLGYCAKALGQELQAQNWQVSGTVRSDERKKALEDEGFTIHLFDPVHGKNLSPDALEGVTHILISAPPGENGDVAVRQAAELLKDKKNALRWIGYFSTTGVYGDHDGGFVDETTPPSPASRRGARRVRAELDWLALAKDIGVPLDIFRLPGIYGPGRNALVSLKNGKARRIVKKGQVFSRIHRDDIVTAVRSAMKSAEGEIYNIVDDEAAPPQDVTLFAAELLGIEPPPAVLFEEADLSPMARSFYGENKRVKNDKMKQRLGVKLAYPNYREGLRALKNTLG